MTQRSSHGAWRDAYNEALSAEEWVLAHGGHILQPMFSICDDPPLVFASHTVGPAVL